MSSLESDGCAEQDAQAIARMKEGQPGLGIELRKKERVRGWGMEEDRRGEINKSPGHIL